MKMNKNKLNKKMFETAAKGNAKGMKEAMDAFGPQL